MDDYTYKCEFCGKVYDCREQKHYTIDIPGEKFLKQTCSLECAELIQAISKAKRGKLDADNMAEEIADVLIGIEWLKELYDIDALEVQKWIAYKQNRIAKKLENRG